MIFVRALADLSSAELATVGPKARACADLLRAGFDVPNGFVVHCPHGEVPTAEVNAAARAMGEGLLAVRSAALAEDGAGHSFAGIHASFLNVTQAEVAQMVGLCLASMHSERAADYRARHNLPAPAGAQTVLVQRMIDAHTAGVAFTIDPVSRDRNVMVVSASWGNGEAVVSGIVDPDELRIERATCATVTQRVGSKAFRVIARGREQRRVPTEADEQARLCLDAAKAAALATLLLRVEAHCGTAQDVEWCHDGQRFWLLQSRAITSAARTTSADGIEWSRTNVREVMPDLPTPQTLDLMTDLVNEATREYFGGLLAPEAELGPMLKSFGGRPYFNLSQFRHLARASFVPPALFIKAMGHADALHSDDHRITFPPLRQLVRNLPTMGRIVVDQTVLGWRAKRRFAAGQRTLHDLRKRDMEDRSDEQMLAIVDGLYDYGRDALCSAYTCGSFLQWQVIVEQLCRRVGFPADLLLNSQLAVGEKSVSAQQAFDLLRISHIGRADHRVVEYFTHQPESDPTFRVWGRALRGSLFKRELHAFIDTYGHRGVREIDIAVPRYREDPTPLLFAIASLVTAPETPQPHEIDARLEDEARRVWSDFRQAVPLGWRETLLPVVGWIIGHIKRMYVFRERNKFEMVRFLEPVREVAREMSKRFVQRGWIDVEDDYYMLTIPDVKRAVRARGGAGDLRAVVGRRRDERARYETLRMPLLLAERDVAAALEGAAEISVDPGGVSRLGGDCTSVGVAEGEVVVLQDPRDFARMNRGAILVAPATDPSWTPLFTLAAGVVTEIGGALSHASTVAREYGLPALANVKDATRLLREGERVRLNATAGWVERVANPSN